MSEHYLERIEGARDLVNAGIRQQAAVRLARAGFTSLEKIGAVTRDDLLAVLGVNLRTIEECEAILGRKLPWPTAYWREQGLPTKLARLLHKSGIDSLETLGRMSFKDLRALGLGVESIRRCEQMLGRFLQDG